MCVELPVFFHYNLNMANKELYEIIVNNLPHGFMAVDRNGITVDFNKAAEQITGFSRDEVIGKSHMELFHDSSNNNDCPLWRHAFEHRQEMLSVEHVITKKTGEQAILSVSIAPLFDADGSFAGGIELLSDVSDQKKRERERKNVLSMFAHDMKNSVLIASGFVCRLEALKCGPLTESQCSALGTVRQELAALEKMIFALRGKRVCSGKGGGFPCRRSRAVRGGHPRRSRRKTTDAPSGTAGGSCSDHRGRRGND